MRPADDLAETLDADSTGYATPWHVDGPEQCLFYHSMDLPGMGTQIGAWDLRNCTDSYLGYQDVRDRRVVDVGAASGFLSFEMEKRGASVVAFDVSLDVQEFAADIIPRHDTVAVSGPTKEQVLARLRGDLMDQSRGRPNEISQRDPGLAEPEAAATIGYPGGHVEGFPDTFRALFYQVYGDVEKGAPSADPTYPTFADGHDAVLVTDAVGLSHREQRWTTVQR